ncbi:MAG: hypothetical protein GY861_25020, partial [bacterium]|nr:hypothetical protein [bacterium]
MSYDKKNWKANKVAERKGLEAKLDTFLKGALTSKVDIDKLTSHYKIAGLYAYSFRNQIMIMMQGGHGTIAMSKTKWGQFGREVTPEEKRRNNIIIFMPVFRDEIDPSTGKKESVLKFFRNVGLYRAEQTEG